MSKSAFQDYFFERRQIHEANYQFITQAIKDGPLQLKSALGELVRGHGIEHTCRKTGLSRPAIHKIFSKNGNPTYKNLVAILSVFGLELTVKPMDQENLGD